MSSGKPITFLDTPGHAAFLAMRQRGAEVTDIVVLVVAADDSVMPQTLEALKHAREAKVPIIVAITKVDKPEARVETVKRDLSSQGVEIEDFGGDVQVVCVSGKTGQGMSELEDNILALSEILDVRGETDGMAEGWVLEASIKPVGKAATVLVKRGTLRPGDCIVAGTTWARVRVLRNDAGQEIDEAPPGTPAEVLGWRDGLPDAGDPIIQAEDEPRARCAVDYRNEMKERQSSFDQAAAEERQRREAEAEAKAKAEAEEAAARGGTHVENGLPEKDGTSTPSITTVNFIVKGDVVGSVEAMCGSIQEIGNHEIRPRILSAGAGQITESDIEYAATTDAVIINFNNSVPGHIKSMAQASSVHVIDRSVIYHLADDVRAVMTAKLPPRFVQKVIGEAEVLQVFPINVHKRVYKNIAGCEVRNGMVHRSDNVRIMRRGTKVFDGTCDPISTNNSLLDTNVFLFFRQDRVVEAREEGSVGNEEGLRVRHRLCRFSGCRGRRPDPSIPGSAREEDAVKIFVIAMYRRAGGTYGIEVA
jgi:translation initiation factor IF-2